MITTRVLMHSSAATGVAMAAGGLNTGDHQSRGGKPGGSCL